MFFPSLEFLLFFLVVWPIAWALAGFRLHVTHKLFIILISLFFYAFWNLYLSPLLLTTAVFDWVFGRLIGICRYTLLRRTVLTVGILSNLFVLSVFRYQAWIIQQLDSVLAALHLGHGPAPLDLLVPIGVSFYTFQGISYLVDVYRGQVSSRSRLVDVLFLLTFFPHLIAGPIVRASQLLPQLAQLPDPRCVMVGAGLLLIGSGLIKKTVIAGTLGARLVDPVFLDPLGYGALDVMGAIIAYAVQIYCDFSGYSDMAIGLAALFGYRYPQNFNQPYRARSVSEFWRRWHISLSTWFRDYVYIPLGGSRASDARMCVNVLITLLLCGLWHGAAWKFLVWGGLHGTFVALERLDRRKASRLRQRGDIALPSPILGMATTFAFICATWVVFRADELGQAGRVFAGLGRWSVPPTLLTPWLVTLVVVGLGLHFGPPDLLVRLDRLYGRLPPLAIGIILGFVLLACEAFGGDARSVFIYFQF